MVIHRRTQVQIPTHVDRFTEIVHRINEIRIFGGKIINVVTKLSFLGDEL